MGCKVEDITNMWREATFNKETKLYDVSYLAWLSDGRIIEVEEKFYIANEKEVEKAWRKKFEEEHYEMLVKNCFETNNKIEKISFSNIKKYYERYKKENPEKTKYWEIEGCGQGYLSMLMKYKSKKTKENRIGMIKKDEINRIKDFFKNW